MQLSISGILSITKNTANETDSEEKDGQHNPGTSVLSIMGAYVPGTLIGPAFGSEFLLAKTEIVLKKFSKKKIIM
ncbi:MAG: hypothetical protein CM1200mP10_09160 [Candidatus Neomarinimicrobiota bacterium]|nr:MAG: hypothetical protein CM1200mP10_09160 [Candidatus Neomarinimicrobiota bacterium]